jgi:hypothetical protein
MKTPKTLTGKINAIHKVFPIREIWFCNAGFGIMYLVPKNMQSKHPLLRGNKTAVFSYFRTLEQCVNSEYKRIVLKKKIRGGSVDGSFEKKPNSKCEMARSIEENAKLSKEQIFKIKSRHW